MPPPQPTWLELVSRAANVGLADARQVLVAIVAAGSTGPMLVAGTEACRAQYRELDGRQARHAALLWEAMSKAALAEHDGIIAARARRRAAATDGNLL